MNRIRTIVLAFAVALIALFGASAAQAACDVTGGTATTFKCDGTGVNVRVDSGTDVTLDVTDMTIEGTNDSTGYITFHNNSGVPADLTLNIENTSIDSPAYLGVYAATGDIGPTAAPGDLTLTIDEASSITAWDAGIYARAYDGGVVTVTNYADIFAGTPDETMVFGGVGISATADAGSVTLENYGDVTSYSGRGLYADGGYASGAEKVSIYNEGEVDAFGDAIRAIAGGSFGTDAEIVNHGTVTGTDRRGIVAWSDSGDTTIENYGAVTSYGGQAIYGMADEGIVTITNDATVRVLSDPEEDDLDDTSFAGIEAAVSGTGDIEIIAIADSDIESWENGIYAHTGQGSIRVTNDGLVVAGWAGIVTDSTGGDVTIENTGSISSSGFDCLCEQELFGTITINGADLGDVVIDNKEGGVIAANRALSFTPTEEWLDTASAEELTDLSSLILGNFAIGGNIESADSVLITNDGTIVGSIGVGHEDELSAYGTARIVNNGLWITSFIAGFDSYDGVVENNGRWQTLGGTMLAGNLENSGDLVVSSLAAEAEEMASGAFLVYGNYTGSGAARLVLDFPYDSYVGYSPALGVMGEVSGVTEIVIGRGEALEGFDWDGSPFIPLVSAPTSESTDAGHFYMEDASWGLLNFRLVYDDSAGQAWYLALDTTEGTEALADIPFAARNLYRLATEGVTDRLDELRNGGAAGGAASSPLGYAATPDDPVTAALGLSQPAPPTTNAWIKTTGRYGEGDGYDVLSGVLEAGIDTLIDAGSGTVAIGAFGGMGGAQVAFDLDDSRATLTGPLVGAYANYATGRAFFGAIAAVQTLDVDATLSGADTSFGGITYGGRIDAGYRFGDELIVEPAVALAASRTQFDTFEMNAMDVGFVDTDSLATEARLRIAREFALDGVTVTPFAIATLGHDFLGGDGVDVPPSEVMMGNNGGTYGDLSAGVSVTNDAGTLSGFARGNLGYAAGEVSAGLKLGANAAF